MPEFAVFGVIFLDFLNIETGETVILYEESKENSLYSPLEESWEYVSMKIESCLRYFQIQFSDGRKWEPGGDVFSATLPSKAIYSPFYTSTKLKSKTKPYKSKLCDLPEVRR